MSMNDPNAYRHDAPSLEDMGDDGRTFALIPGGKGGNDHIAVALLVLAAIAYLIILRRTFRMVLAA